MPTVDKKGNYGVDARKGEVGNEVASATESGQNNNRSPTKAKKSLTGRSAFSETDLKAKFAATEDGSTTKDGVLARYSESDIQLVKLDVPLVFDDSRSEVSGLSGGSGLAIVPFSDGRSLISQESGQDLVPVENEMVSAEGHDKNLEQEEKDIVPSLPEGWPQFRNRSWRRRSCELVKSTSSCVRKAVSHLYQLQDLIDSFYMTEFLEEEERFSKQRSSMTSDLEFKDKEEVVESQGVPEDSSHMSSASSHGRRIRWLLSSASLGNIEEEGVSFEPRLESSASGATLEIRGRSARTVISKLSTPKSAPKSAEMPVPKEYDVIEEVISLLGRMESDRLSTQDALVKERERVQKLRDEIDTQAYKRMHDLPLAVQREHEACAIDINELRWHCAYQGRIEARISERVHHAEVRHAKVLQDLSNIQRHCPLVEEKLDLEGEAMSSIQLKQDETDEELDNTLDRLAATERKTAEAKGKAAQERSLIKQDVDVVRNELNAVSDELAQLRMYFTSNTHTMNDIRNTLRENAEQLVILEGREERIKALEATQQDKVQRLREKIVEQEAEHIKLVSENNKLKTDKQITQASMESENAKLEHEIKNASKRLRGLTSRIKETKLEITSLNKKLEQCAKQKISDEKAIKRAEQEMGKIEEQMKVSKEETKKVEVLHNNLTETLVVKKEEVMGVEESLKTTADALKKQLKDEAHARTVLQARITSDTHDLAKTHVDSKKKREKATQRADEIVKLVDHVRDQVSKLEKIHNERQETIAQLDKILEKVAQQHNDMETKFQSEIAELRPKEAELKKETMEFTKRLDHITWKSEMMEKKMADIESSTQMMNKVIATTQENINDLTEEMTELKIQIETGFETEQDLKKSLQQLEERIRRGKDNHEMHILERNEVLTTNQGGVKTALSENKKLAVVYQRLQNTLLNNRAALLRLVERRVNNEHSLKDHRELFVLQGRMREALEYFYRLRGLQSKADIAEFELKCIDNGDKLVTLQSDMMRVIEHINRFLEANNAAHDVISMEAAKIAQTPTSGTMVA
ncbi:coiled-coil domain-containing protein 178-like [Orbicella faveolata]|uniref:coiled-coil domain-containing protein 178-like n=1 Tax=Orbicella faveolata TaxID=48498 RepID=UPI0009E528FC|nr:coiled-coil domain-containing protein 178-like [Orbicella faveolata]